MKPDRKSKKVGSSGGTNDKAGGIAARRKALAAAEGYALSDARRAEIIALASALGEEVMVFPGRSADRVRWAHRIRIAAERDAAELVQTPFHDEAPLTVEEIAAQRDVIETFREVQSECESKRGAQDTASQEFALLAEEAAALKATLLRVFAIRFRKDPAGKARLKQIRAGSGDADLVQDVSDLGHLAKQHMAYLATCPRNEAANARRILAISPRLSHLLGAKTLDATGQSERDVRNRIYTLMMTTDRRVRAAADYWYGGTSKIADYAAYVPSTRGTTAVASSDTKDTEGEPAAPAEPTPVG